MLDKQEYNVRQGTLPLSSQECQINTAYTQKRRQEQQGGSGATQKSESKEICLWSEAMLLRCFESLIEKLDGKKEGSRQARRNVVDDGGGEHLVKLAEVFAKRLERARRGKFTFLLVGRAGAGRANPINALLGDDIVPGDEQVHETFQVITHEHRMVGSRFSIIDTPGLCDIAGGHMKEYVYVTRLEDGAPRFDGLWFVTPLHEAGIMDGERRAMELITRAYGRDAWRYSLVVLTHPEYLRQGMECHKMYQEKIACIRREIARLAGEEIAAEIPAVAYAPEMAPVSKEWLSELYISVSLRMSDQGYLPFLLTTAKRLKFLLLKSGRKSARSIRIRVYSASQSAAAQERAGYIYIDEEKGHEIERRMQDYLMSVAQRNNSSSHMFEKE